MAPGDGKKTATRTCTAQLTRLVGRLREIQFCRGERPWLLLDLTMAQLKAMMLIVQSGGVRSRELADGLGIAPSVRPRWSIGWSSRNWHAGRTIPTIGASSGFGRRRRHRGSTTSCSRRTRKWDDGSDSTPCRPTCGQRCTTASACCSKAPSASWSGSKAECSS